MRKENWEKRVQTREEKIGKNRSTKHTKFGHSAKASTQKTANGLVCWGELAYLTRACKELLGLLSSEGSVYSQP